MTNLETLDALEKLRAAFAAAFVEAANLGIPISSRLSSTLDFELSTALVSSKAQAYDDIKAGAVLEVTALEAATDPQV